MGNVGRFEICFIVEKQQQRIRTPFPFILSQQIMLEEREVLLIREDQMIEQMDPEDLACHLQPVGHFFVLLAGAEVPARMIMSYDDRRGPEFQGRGEHFRKYGAINTFKLLPCRTENCSTHKLMVADH